MTRKEAIETLLNSKFEAWKILPAMSRALFEHRYPTREAMADRNAIIAVIAERLSDEKLCDLAVSFGGDPHPPLILSRKPRKSTVAAR